MIYTLRDTSGILDPHDFARPELALIAARSMLWRDVPWELWETNSVGITKPRLITRAAAR